MPPAARIRRAVWPWVAACVLLPQLVAAQEMTGTLTGTVRDAQGGVLQGAAVRVSSPALIGGPAMRTTNEKGQLRFPALPPGRYAVDVEFPGLAPYHAEGIPIGAGATIEVAPVLKLAELGESIVVEGAGSRVDPRDPGFATRFGPEDLRAIPTRRASMFDTVRSAPGISPTSPSSATTTTVSAFGSGTNENQFLIDGTNTTCPCNGIARAEIGVDFMQEVRVQSVGASAEFGNMQGAVINVVTRQGGDRFLYDASYYSQMPDLTSQPVMVPLAPPSSGMTGYERARYRDFTTNLGGPVLRNRLWFFTGYQYLRDYDSQPGTDPAFPRTYEQDKIFAKLTWRLTPGMQLLQSFHEEFWINPDTPTIATPFEATRHRSASVPAVTFGHLTHTVTANTVWDVRVGRFVYDEKRTPATGDWTRPNRLDSMTGVSSGAPPLAGGLLLLRTTVKAALNQYRPSVWGADHQLKIGGQVERGEQRGANVIPTGARFVDSSGQPDQRISSDPSSTGGLALTFSAFATDTLTVGDRLTINAGIRFDHSRAVSQDLPVVDSHGEETGEVVRGLGTLYTWNVWSPRLGITAKLTPDGRTMLRATYGRFVQSVLTGELSPFHPGVTPITTTAFDTATGGYTRLIRTVDSRNLVPDPDTHPPHTDEYAAGIDREIGRRIAVAIAYVHKRGRDFIGWTDIGGQYREEARTLPDGRSITVYQLVNSTADQRFLLTNPEGYALSYNGLVIAVDKRQAGGWQAFASYTYSRTTGLQASSGETAAGAQASTVAMPTRTFGRDPNDLTNAWGRLPNDRPHIFRLMGTLDVPRTGIVIAMNLQQFSGKPWGATTQVRLRQGNQRIALEPRGTRRLESQTLLDLRVSRAFRFGAAGRIELLLDALNLLNETAGEGLVSDDLYSPTFGQPTLFVDPRRVMLGVRLNLGR